MPDTISILEAIEEKESARTAFSIKLEEPVVATILAGWPQFCRIDYLRPEHFERLHCRYVIAHILNYWEEYGVVPTRNVLYDICSGQLSIDDDYWEDILALIKREPELREIPYVRDQIAAWIKQQSYARLYSDDSMDAFRLGKYDVIDEIVREAASLGSLDQKEPFGFVSADEFLNQEFDAEWLVEGAMIAGQPMLVGGKKKTLKTGILCDLAISLATGGRFLAQFKVPEPRKVAFFSSESGPQDVHHRLQAIMRAKSLDGLQGNLHLSFERPRLSNDGHRKKIAEFLRRRQIEVVIIDPLYLTLLTGKKDANAGNLFDMGGVYAEIADLCAAEGATPVLCHHFKKSAAEDMDLDDFTYTGAAEFARQSLLVARRGDYTDARNNQLRLKLHGYGRGATYAVHIDEGTLDDPKWGVTMTTETEQQRNEHRSKLQKDVARLQNALLELAESESPITKQAIREELGWSGAKCAQVINAAIEEGVVEESRMTLPDAAGRSRQVACYCRVK